MNQDFAILELKYGNIYGGFPNFFAVAEISLLVFERRTNKIFLETFINTADVDYVSVYSRTDDLGHTISREREVVNMRTGRPRQYDENFQHDEQGLRWAFNNLRPVHMNVKRFMWGAMNKYRVETLVVFDGRRDLFLCEKAGVEFYNTNIFDLQKALNKETDYLFSLNKLSKVINFRLDGSYLRSNNLEYWLHPIAAKQIIPGTAGWDAVRLLMVHNEYEMHHQDFIMKAALLLNKIQKRKEEKALAAGEEPPKAPPTIGEDKAKIKEKKAKEEKPGKI